MGVMALWRPLARPLRYAALAAGALPTLAFPQLNLEFLGWCGLVPAILIIRTAPSAREAAVRGWWLGAGFILASLYWLVPNIGPGVLLVAVVFGVLWTGFGLAAWALLRPPLRPARALAALAVLPGYWVFTEWARSWQGFGGPWDVLGASQWQHPAVLALAAVGGVWLISFALVAANTGIAILLLARGLAVRAAGAAGVAVALAAGPVAFALIAAVPPVRQVSVALVQPGITSSKNQRVDASLQLSGRLGAGQLGTARPDLIVWGESSVGTDLERQPVLFGQIRRLAAGTGAQVLVNQDASLPDGARSKVALLIGPHGITGSYTKTRLVPFGEYIPLRGALGWIARISKAAASNMVPGDGAHLVHATDRLGRPLPLGVLICFESAFPDMSRFDADLGAQLIVYQTSDSTFQRTWAPAQHAALSAVRAAETGRPVVQAALTGDTVAFDARGRLLARMTTGQRGVTLVRLGLPPAAARTPYDQLGDYVPWAATGIVLVAAITGFLMVRRVRGGRVPWDGNPRRARSVSTVGASPGNSGEGQH
ncbi:MAG: apolipoprotein N-acyltransferase [Streptosporangiaceae bacterium]|jgi:apolipoprotein N-acyltransferase|nr:apolipoprotein N-acyltransferase [Streptosporangiaceae bacterium]